MQSKKRNMQKMNISLNKNVILIKSSIKNIRPRSLNNLISSIMAFYLNVHKHIPKYIRF